MGTNVGTAEAGAAAAWARASKRRAAVGLVSAAVLLAALGACKRDPGELEAERVATDKLQLNDAVLRDVELDAVMHKADVAAENGNDDEAASILESQAVAAADRALSAAMALHPASSWGTARATELTALVRERRDSIAPYAAALKGDDLDAKLATAQTQLALEQKAMLVLAHVNGELEGATLPALVDAGHVLAAPPAPSASPALTEPHPDAHR